MAPKAAEQKVSGDQTPEGEKKKDDTTPTPVVDKEVTPSEDDKKKKDTSSTAKKGSTSRTGTSRSGHTQLTELTELSPNRDAAIGMSAGKRKDAASRGRHFSRAMGAHKMLKKKRHMAIMNAKLKHLRKAQAKKQKHPRSFQHNIMRILRSVNDSPSDLAGQPKRVNQLSMMIFDSFANDLCDKICAAAVELVKNTNKRQLGSTEVKAAMKLVLPTDMASCCEEAVNVSLASYRESTKKFQAKIAKAKGNKKAASTQKD